MLFGTKKRYVVQTLGSEVLRRKADPIPAVTPEIVELAAYMLEALRRFDGIGIAAPQVGRSLRLVVLAVPPESISDPPSPGERELLPRMPLILVNPEIVERFGEPVARDEGCLSVPEIFAPVVRPERVILRAQTLEGEVISGSRRRTGARSKRSSAGWNATARSTISSGSSPGRAGLRR